MRQLIAASILAALAPLALAQSGGMKSMDMKDMDMNMKKDHKGMNMKEGGQEGHGVQKGSSKAGTAKSADGKVHSASGTVRSVDKAKGTVTLAHEPVPSMNWPAMTMAYKVKDKALLDRAKPGSKVQFSFVQSGKDSVITELK